MESRAIGGWMAVLAVSTSVTALVLPMTALAQPPTTFGQQQGTGFGAPPPSAGGPGSPGTPGSPDSFGAPGNLGGGNAPVPAPTFSPPPQPVFSPQSQPYPSPRSLNSPAPGAPQVLAPNTAGEPPPLGSTGAAPGQPNVPGTNPATDSNITSMAPVAEVRPLGPFTGDQSGAKQQAQAQLVAANTQTATNVTPVSSVTTVDQGAGSSVTGAPDALTEEASDQTEESADGEDANTPIWANYYGVLFGPSVQSPSSFQATPTGEPDPNHPVLVRNYLTAGHDFGEDISVAATGFFTWVPVQGQQLIMQDPSARVSFNRIINTEDFNWYGDVRVHLAVSGASRDADLLGGLQTFHYVGYQATRRLSVGSYFSVRYNYFGSQGVGSDIELYSAPNLNYQLKDGLSLTAMYELGASHPYGGATGFTSDGTAFQPGVAWDINKSVTVNPYLIVYTGNGISAASTSVGMTMSWIIL